MEPRNRLMAQAPGTAGQPPQKATLQPAAAKAGDIPFTDYEFQSEDQLLALANQSRRQAGAPPLTLDPGHIANDSVSSMPAFFFTSSISHSVPFSV